MDSSDTTITLRKEIKGKIESDYKEKYETWNGWFIRMFDILDEKMK